MVDFRRVLEIIVALELKGQSAAGVTEIFHTEGHSVEATMKSLCVRHEEKAGQQRRDESKTAEIWGPPL